MPEFKIIAEDPLNILKSTQTVLENSRFVFINDKNLEPLTEKVLERFSRGLFNLEQDYGSTGNTEKNIQLIFIENAVNFCFWPDKDKIKWQIEWPAGNIVSGGWYALKACFDRALAEGVPILDSGYLSDISQKDVQNFFRGIEGTEIPLLKERMENLREAGKVLLEKYEGKFSKTVEKSDFDAIKIVQLLIDDFPSFRDISMLNGEKIFFLKRAQICPSDISYIFKNTSQQIKNLECLTIFADYKLPQILRMFSVLEYTKELAEKVDNMIEISHDSREEIEIRAATIWAAELLRQKIRKLTATEIDNTLWLLSQEIKQGEKPYHRARTIFY